MSPKRDRELRTFSQLHAEYRIGIHLLKRAAARGEFPTYSVSSSVPRVRVSDFEVWLESTRLPREVYLRRP